MAEAMRIREFSGWIKVFLRIEEHYGFSPTTSPTQTRQLCNHFSLRFGIVSTTNTHYADPIFASKSADLEQPSSARSDHPDDFNYLEADFSHYYDSFPSPQYLPSIAPKQSFQLFTVLEICTSSVFQPFPQPLFQPSRSLTQLLRQHIITQHNDFSDIQSLNAPSSVSIRNIQPHYPKSSFFESFTIPNFS